MAVGVLLLNFPSQYIFSLLLFLTKYRDLFLPNSEIHDIDTPFNCNLHLPSTNLTLVQKGIFLLWKQYLPFTNSH